MRRLAWIPFVLIAACAGGLRFVTEQSPGGAVRLDQDGDGFAGAWVCPADKPGCDADALNKQPIANLDCNDNDKSTYPGAPDKPGDGIDQNCDGADGIAQALPPGPI